MPISEDFIPAGGPCPSCGEPYSPYYVKVKKTTVFGGDVIEIGREGPACWNDECPRYGKPIR